jgi:PAS domain S-box-containing protein
LLSGILELLNLPNAKIPAIDEAARAAIARSYQLDDAGVRRQLDRLAELAARICNAPIGLVSLVMGDDQLFLGKSGIDAASAAREHSFCAQAMHHAGTMIVPDARADRRFADNPMVNSAPHIRFYAGQPLVSPEGAPLGAFCVIDSDPRLTLSPEQRETLETLAEAAMALLEKRRLAVEHQRQSAATRAELAHMGKRFDVLVDALPQLVWSTPPDGMSDYFSAQWCVFTGASAEASYGRGWLDFLHPEDVEPSSAAWAGAVESGESYAVNYRLRRHDGEYVWMLARGLPVHDEAGAVVRWLGTCTDIHGQVQTSELLEMMSQELSHRIKNLFAVTQGLIAMTLRKHPELKPVAGELQSRLLALGRAHDLVRPRIVGSAAWHSETSLHQLLDKLLLPYATEDRPRWRISGSDVAVGEQAATPLALFFHEMATNSAKYGALSTRDGHLDIHMETGDAVAIHWQESGGPLVNEPATRGFGYRLAELSIVRQLSGSLKFDWLPGGLNIFATVPLANIGVQLSRANATGMRHVN